MRTIQSFYMRRYGFGHKIRLKIVIINNMLQDARYNRDRKFLYPAYCQACSQHFILFKTLFHCCIYHPLMIIWHIILSQYQHILTISPWQQHILTIWFWHKHFLTISPWHQHILTISPFDNNIFLPYHLAINIFLPYHPDFKIFLTYQLLTSRQLLRRQKSSQSWPWTRSPERKR